MSLHARIDGEALALPAGASVQMELLNPLLQDTLQEEESTPLAVPAEGNERLLEHVHHLPLSTRTLVRSGGELGHGGLPLHPGDWHVLSSDEREVRLAFLREGFVRLTKGLKLPDCLKNELIDLTDELLNQSISLKHRPTYANGGKCQFPMFYAPNLYPSDARPLWMRTGSAWNDTQAYAVDDLVQFTERDDVERTDLWQCIVTTSAGESPATHPSKWRRTAQGIVNAWDRTANDFYFNTEGNEFYAFVPWFYLKWVLKKALEHIGYVPRGTWWDDTTFDEQSLGNTTTIDAPTETESDSIFYVQQTGTTYFSGTWFEWMHLTADAESPAPYQDLSGLWDSSTGEFIPDAEGTWAFNVRTRAISAPAGALARLYIRREGSESYWLVPGMAWVIPYDPVAVGQAVTGPNGEVTMRTGNIPFGTDDVGVRFQFHLRISQNGEWPVDGQDGVTGTRIRGWLLGEEPGVPVNDVFVYPHRHVPDVELAGFIQAVADAYNLEWYADSTSRTVWLNSREQVLARRDHERTEASARAVGSVELDHERRTTGMVLSWGIDTTNEADSAASVAEAMSTEDLPPPISLGDSAVLTSTREYLKARFDYDEGLFYWVTAGYRVPDYVQGDEATATTVGPAMVPVHMVRKMLDGKEYIMPWIDAQGTSAWFHCEGERDTVWISMHHPAKSHDGTVTGVPCARSWHYGWNSADTGPASLLWDGTEEVPGLVQRQWANWITMLLEAEPVTRDLLLDHAFIRGRDWTRVLHIHGQDYLVQSMPVEYGPGEHLVSRGAYLLRLKQAGVAATNDPCYGAGLWPSTAVLVDFAARASDQSTVESYPPTLGDRFLIMEHTTGSPGTNTWEQNTGNVAVWNGSGWDFEALSAGTLVAGADEIPYWLIVNEEGTTIYTDNGGTGRFACQLSSLYLAELPGTARLFSTDEMDTASDRADRADACRLGYLESTADGENWEEFEGPYTEAELLAGVEPDVPLDSIAVRVRWMRGGAVQTYSQT